MPEGTYPRLIEVALPIREISEESSDFILTRPEVVKLRQLEGRSWLSVVTSCKSERPKLRIIQDPTSKLTPEMLYRQVQFLVEEGDGDSQGEEVLTNSEGMF